MKQPTCSELGFCQALAECPLDFDSCQNMCRAECHVACSAPPQQRYPFATGVIDQGEPAGRLEEIGFWSLLFVCVAAVAAIVGFSAGYIPLPGLHL